jgi:hypothetical protein
MTWWVPKTRIDSVRQVVMMVASNVSISAGTCCWVVRGVPYSAAMAAPKLQVAEHPPDWAAAR